jgi:hypothetical protein
LKGDNMRFSVYRRLGTVEIYDQILATVWVRQMLCPWNVILDKLIVVQLAKKFSAFYRTRRWIVVFKRARHWTLCGASWFQSTSSHTLLP